MSQINMASSYCDPFA
jgi:hypothetical protein